MLGNGFDGSAVGTLAWHKSQPGWEFVKRVTVGLAIALPKSSSTPSSPRSGRGPHPYRRHEGGCTAGVSLFA
jgi:hypothetical protein